MKRILFTGVMSCLTVTAMSACNWQYRRYQESIRKWKLIDEQFKPDYPIQNMEISDILQLDPKKYSYILVKTSGTLDKYILKVYRYQDGRPGMMLCGILRDNSNEAIIVNLGWVPENYLDQIESIEGIKLKDMCGMIKLPEHPDKNTDQNLMNTFIDLELIAKENQLQEKSKKLYLERLGTSTENAGLFKSQDLYPVPSFYSTFQKPYLTPDKHRAYYWFWGSCSQYKKICSQVQFKLLIKVLKSIDLFGQNILLNLNGEDEYKTAFGGFFTLMILGIVVLFFQSNIRDFINKVNIQSETTEVFEDEPDSIQLNESNFMFAVAIEQVNFNTNPFFNITLRQRQYERLENGTLIKRDQHIDLIPCTLDRFQNIFTPYALNFTQQYREIGLDTWLCPQFNYSVSLKGRYTNKYFDFLKIAVNECSNQTQSNSFFTWKPVCASQELLDEWLLDQRSFRVKLYITNKVINPEKGDEYIQSFLDDELFFSFVPNIIGKETDVFFTKYILHTDNNLLPTSEESEASEIFAKQEGDYRDQGIYAAEQFAAIYLRRSPYTNYISRSYQKLDKLLSILGGFANIVFVVLGFFVGIYNKQQYLIELANEVYDFHFGNENKAKFERQQLVKEITYVKSQSKIISQRCSPVSSINPANQSINQNPIQSIRPVISHQVDCTLVIHNDKVDSEQKQHKSNKSSVINLQPVGDNEIEWESIDKSMLSCNLTQNNNHTDIAMFGSTAKFHQERQSKTQIDQEQKSMKQSIKQMHKQIVNKIGIHNRKEYLTKQIQMMLDRSRPIVFTFKFVLHQLFCGKLFQDKNCILLDKAIKKINQDLDICVLIDKVNEINLIKELLLERDQQILFNFAPKEVITIEDQFYKHHLPGRRDSKRAFTKRLGVQFSDVAKMMFDKKFKKGQFVNPGLQIYYKLYQAYERVILSEEKNNRFNKILIEKLGQEVKEVFDISNYIQVDKNRMIMDKLKKKKVNLHEDEVEDLPGLLSMDQRDLKQSMIK
ncbi:unnamed protein product [Paramecium primaurelia]|uniref:Transmembrane protein n=1 Tax=Paramecium primaurelia TaxID=5886 RepID=A0A8S1LGC3_PARPR|nr:unnamed protein product [Paramecium primaurelia]